MAPEHSARRASRAHASWSVRTGRDGRAPAGERWNANETTTTTDFDRSQKRFRACSFSERRRRENVERDEHDLKTTPVREGGGTKVFRAQTGFRRFWRRRMCVLCTRIRIFLENVKRQKWITRTRRRRRRYGSRVRKSYPPCRIPYVRDDARAEHYSYRAAVFRARNR